MDDESYGKYGRYPTSTEIKVMVERAFKEYKSAENDERYQRMKERLNSSGKSASSEGELSHEDPSPEDDPFCNGVVNPKLIQRYED